MSRPTISPGSQQSRSGYPPPGAPQQIQRQLQDDTTITIRTHQPGSSSAQTQGAWLDTHNAESVQGVQDTWDGDGEIDDDANREDAQLAWNRAFGAVSAINTQIRELCSQDAIKSADLTLMFKALKSARASSQLSLLRRGGEDKVLPALGAGLLRLVSKLSQALADARDAALDVREFDTSAIATVCDGLRAAIGMTRGESLFTTVQLSRLKAPMRLLVDTLMQRALASGLPAEQKSNYELLSILKLLSRGLKLRFKTEEGQSDTLLSKHSEIIGEVFWKSLHVIRDWPANPDEKGGNESYVSMLDTRQLGITMVQLNTLPKQQLRDLDEEVEAGLTCRQLLGQCALKLCGGKALIEFKLWTRPNASPLVEKMAPVLSHAPVSSVVVANISNTIKDFSETAIIPATSPELPGINSKLLRWMNATLLSGDAAPDSQSFSNFANFLRTIAETGLRGQPLPVEDVAEFDAVCRQVLEGCTQIRPTSSADDGDVQHLANLASFVKAMARRGKLEGYLYRRSAGSLVRAMTPHAGNVQQAESLSGLLAGCVYFMQSGVLPVQAVQSLVESLLNNGTPLVKPYWQASMRKQVLQAIVGWLSDLRVAQFGDVAHAVVPPMPPMPPMLDAILKCHKPGDEPLAYLKALQLIAQRYPATLVNYLPLLSAITARTVTLADAASVIAQAISNIGDEPPVAAIAVDEPPQAPPPAPKPVAAIEPVRPGSANWQPIGGVLVKPPTTTGGDEGKAGKEGSLRLANRKKHRQAKRERMQASEPVANVRNTAPSGEPASTQATTSNTRHIITNLTSSVINHINARPTAASSTTAPSSTASSSATTTNSTTISTTNTKKSVPTASKAVTASPANKGSNTKAADSGGDQNSDKANTGSTKANANKSGGKNSTTKGTNQGAGNKSSGKASISTTSTTNLPKPPQVKGTPREQWQFHFTKSKDDSTQGLDALLSREPALLMQKTGSGAAAQPALFHAISRGQPEKLSWLITQLEERGITLDIATIFPMLDRVFESATLVEDGHKQALQRFIAACERRVPDWQGAFAAYLKEQGAMIPVGFGLTIAPASASSAATGTSARMTWRERERYKGELRSARQLKNELDAEMLQLTGGRAPTMEDWQAYSAMTAAQLLKKGNVDGGLLIEPDEDGDIQIMRQVRNGQWKMATSILDAKLTTEQLLARDAKQQNVLMITITKGHAPMVDTLLEVARNQGGDVLLRMLTARDAQGNTPLTLASRGGDQALVKLLLNAGYVNEQLMQGSAGALAFHDAVTRNDVPMANLLMGHAVGLGLEHDFSVSLENLRR